MYRGTPIQSQHYYSHARLSEQSKPCGVSNRIVLYIYDVILYESNGLEYITLRGENYNVWCDLHLQNDEYSHVTQYQKYSSYYSGPKANL